MERCVASSEAQGGEPHPLPQALVLLYKLMSRALDDAHLFQSPGQLRSSGTPAVTSGLLSSQVAKVLTLSEPTRACG